MSDIVYEKNVFSTPFLSGYSELKIPILDPDGNSAWPACFPVEKINQMRQIVGERHFSAQMMLEFIAPDKIRLDPGGIKFYDDEYDARTSRIGDQNITGACVYWDPSGGRRGGDNSVCTIIYRDDNNHCIFIHDIMYIIVPENTDYPLAYQCNAVLDFVRRHKMRVIMVETNGIGNTLPEIMRTTISRAGYSVHVRPITNSHRKEDRILDAIEPLLSTGRLYAHRRITQTPFISEMLSWSPMGGAEHDDGLDAVSGAISGTPVALHPIGVSLPRYTANTDFKI
jgi:predicted phage terminase large subunit-like protein